MLNAILVALVACEGGEVGAQFGFSFSFSEESQRVGTRTSPTGSCKITQYSDNSGECKCTNADRSEYLDKKVLSTDKSGVNFTASPAPEAQCAIAMQQACNSTRNSTSGLNPECILCCGEHAPALGHAGCSETDFYSFCSSTPMWSIAYEMHSNKTKSSGIVPDFYGFLHYCAFGVNSDIMDAQCAGFFKPDPVLISSEAVLDSAQLKLPFCYDYSCFDGSHYFPNYTRCTDPKFSKMNDRRWIMHINLEPHPPP
jgi:hypothetical protein